MSDPVRFDLQSHSVQSDGALAPAAVVRAARKAGVELLALSDHDTVDGVAEALAAGAQEGIRVVPAVEISALYGGAEDLHILGYGIDAADPGLLDALAGFRADRVTRAERMADALSELGWKLDPEGMRQRRAAGRSIGRPHLAAAVFQAPENGKRLERERLPTASAVLEAYLIPGAPAYRGRTHPTVAEATAVIHAAGGVAVWAHPFWDIDDPVRVRQTLATFAAQGMDGVEAFYVTHDADQVRMLAGVAAELDLLTTGSSDFHGPDHPIFSRFRAHQLHGLTPRLGPVG